MNIDKAKFVELLTGDDGSETARALQAVFKMQADTFIKLQEQSAQAAERNLSKMLDFARLAIDSAIAKSTADPVRAHATLRHARAAETSARPAPSEDDEPLSVEELQTRVIADTLGRSYGSDSAPSGPVFRRGD